MLLANSVDASCTSIGLFRPSPSHWENYLHVGLLVDAWRRLRMREAASLRNMRLAGHSMSLTNPPAAVRKRRLGVDIAPPRSPTKSTLLNSPASSETIEASVAGKTVNLSEILSKRHGYITFDGPLATGLGIPGGLTIWFSANATRSSCECERERTAHGFAVISGAYFDFRSTTC